MLLPSIFLIVYTLIGLVLYFFLCEREESWNVEEMKDFRRLYGDDVTKRVLGAVCVIWPILIMFSVLQWAHDKIKQSARK